MIFRSLHPIPSHNQGWLWILSPGKREQQPCPCTASLNCSSLLLPQDIDNVIWRPDCSLATHGLKLFLQIFPAICVQLSQDQVSLFTAWVGICVLPAFKWIIYYSICLAAFSWARLVQQPDWGKTQICCSLSKNSMRHPSSSQPISSLDYPARTSTVVVFGRKLKCISEEFWEGISPPNTSFSFAQLHPDNPRVMDPSWLSHSTES